MNKRGQIFFADFALSVVLVMLAVGLISVQAEVREYNAKDEQLLKEIRTIGDNASELLVSNPEFLCEAVDDRDSLDIKTIYYLGNCLTQYKAPGPPAPRARGLAKEITKKGLGIPVNYKCNIEAPSAVGTLLTECTDDWSALNKKELRYIYTVKRNVVLLDNSNPGKEDTSFISKANFENCMNGSCDPSIVLGSADIYLRVWK